MPNHRTWFLAEAPQERSIEESVSKDIKGEMGNLFSQTSPSTSKNPTYIHNTSKHSQHLIVTYHPNHISQPTKIHHHRVQSLSYQNIPTPNLPKHTTAGFNHILE